MLALALFLAAANPSYLIETVAGSDRVGDNGPALAGQLAAVHGLAVDRAGNLYAADTDHHRVRRISPQGIITTVAGTGRAGFSGDGGPGDAAQLNAPYGLTVDAAGNLYIADLGNHRVRRLDAATGRIKTVAGNGEKRAGPDGTPAAGSPLMSPRNLALDAAGNLYISEFEGHRIRQVSPQGLIYTVVGTGVAGRNNQTAANLAQVSYPAGLAVDATGALYFADSSNHQIRKVAGGVVSTVLTRPDVLGPLAVAFDNAGSLLLVDNRPLVRRLSADGKVTVAAGTGESGYDGDGLAANKARLGTPREAAADALGNLYIADGARIRKVSAAGIITTYAGDAYSMHLGDGGPGTPAILKQPQGLALDPAGNLYIADSGTGRVRRLSAYGVMSTVATALSKARGVAVDLAGNLLIAETGTHTVRRTVPAGALLPFAGTGTAGLGSDGLAAGQTQLSQPAAVAADLNASIYIADTSNHRILRVSPQGSVTTVAGNGSPGFAGDNGRGELAQLDSPHDVAVDAAGNVYVADTYNHRVRRVGPDGTIQTVASGLNYPQGVAVDASGVLYIADTFNHRVLRAGSPIAGDGEAGLTGDGGPALRARLHFPMRIALAPDGSVFVADSFNDRVRKLSPSGSPPEPLPEPARTITVVNAASLRPGPIAPGSLFVVTGPDVTAGGKVFLDGVAVDVLQAEAGRIMAQAPASIAGKSVVTVEVRADSRPAASASAPVAPAAPALFRGAVNEDGTLNGERNSAARGSVVSVYATGEGQTGLPLLLTIGGAPAEILFQGPAPGLTGVLQVNARIPLFIPDGRLPVLLAVGPYITPDEMSIAVR